MVNWRDFLSMPIWQKGMCYLDQRVLKWIIPDIDYSFVQLFNDDRKLPRVFLLLHLEYDDTILAL